jgi:hypothetical protein
MNPYQLEQSGVAGEVSTLADSGMKNRTGIRPPIWPPRGMWVDSGHPSRASTTRSLTPGAPYRSG